MAPPTGTSGGAAARVALLTGLALLIGGCGGGSESPAVAPDVEATGGAGPPLAQSSGPSAAIDVQIARLPDTPQSDAMHPQAIRVIVACAVCHGAHGEGSPALDAPRIGGLDPEYLARQLDHFRTGIRAPTEEDKYGTQMRAMTLLLDDEEVIADLAAYLSTLEPPRAEPSLEGDSEHGAEIYTVCAACHGPDGRGSRELGSPSLIEQYDWYMVRQLEHFRTGVRGSHPNDVYGMQMRPIVQSALHDRQDMLDVVAYIKTLPRIAGQSPAPSQAPGGNASGPPAETTASPPEHPPAASQANP